MDSVAVIGAGGTMGRAIAKNLAAAGFEVRAWNRTRERAEPLAEAGVTIADTPAEAARGADVVLTMLSDADAVLSSVEGVLADTIWLQMSTIGIEGTERCAELAEKTGVTFVDAPVLGTKAPAEQGELVIMASGPEDVRARVEPLFDAIGKRTMWLGEAGSGSRLKVVVNSWLVAVIEGVAETVALAEGLDLRPELFLEAIAGGPLDLPYAQMKGRAMIERDFEPSFKLRLAAKDAALAEEAARRHDLDLPLVSTIRRRLEEGAEMHGEEDLAATYLTSAAGGVRSRS
jgi:3-hydroxyisobutyrate dehydrogenase